MTPQNTIGVIQHRGRSSIIQTTAFPVVQAIRQAPQLDTSGWKSVWALTLNLKQGRRAELAGGPWVRIDEFKCRQAFKHFMNILNREVYKNAYVKFGKRLRVISVLEKQKDGRWHFHVSIEPPSHLSELLFRTLIRDCWDRVHWAHGQDEIETSADQGWTNYMLKLRQKSEFESFSDCIDWESLYNPVADA